MNKPFYKNIAIFIIIVSAALIAAVLSPKIKELYRVNEFKKLEEFDHYTTMDGKYTVYLKDKTELGLFGATRLNIYLIEAQSDKIRYIGEERIDYYEDFTPYVEYSETDGKVIILFHLKHSNEKIEIEL